MNIEDYLKVVGDYADQIASHDERAQKRSMEVAAALDALYASGVWVDEWLEQKPKPKRPTPRWNPADRNRFIAWYRWKAEQRSETPLARSNAWQLVDAAETCKICHGVTDLATEIAWRPLRWVKKHGYADEAPQVWAIAVEFAGGDPSKVTAKHTREAVAQWKRSKWGKRADGTDRSSQNAIEKVATAKAKANLIRQEVLRDLEEMWSLSALDPAASDEINGLLEDITAWVADHRPAEDAA